MSCVDMTRGRPGSQFLLGTRSPVFSWGGIPRGKAVDGSCFSEIGLIFTCSRESMWHAILSRLREILRRKWDSFGPGTFQEWTVSGRQQIMVTKSTHFTTWVWILARPLTSCETLSRSFYFVLTHKIYKGLEWGLHELMYVLRIVPGRLVLYMCEYDYYEKFELIGKSGLGYIKITNCAHDINY